jgi:hypothetical protein
VSADVSLHEATWRKLIEIAREHDVFLQGKIIRFISPGESPENRAYLDEASQRERTRRQDRLNFTKEVQQQNVDLRNAQTRNEALVKEIQAALALAESAKVDAEEALKTAEAERTRAEQAWKDAKNDLDYHQKRTQFQLVGRIVQSALWVIMGVGLITTGLYAGALFILEDESSVTLLGNTWSNMFGILLTNSFSIIGTIMGVKYATDKEG